MCNLTLTNANKTKSMCHLHRKLLRKVQHTSEERICLKNTEKQWKNFKIQKTYILINTQLDNKTHTKIQKIVMLQIFAWKRMWTNIKE